LSLLVEKIFVTDVWEEVCEGRKNKNPCPKKPQASPGQYLASLIVAAAPIVSAEEAWTDLFSNRHQHIITAAASAATALTPRLSSVHVPGIVN
jgi:hypothetical protein